MNSQLSPNMKALRWCAFLSAGVFATAALPAQQLFDFEGGVEDWYSNDEDPPVVVTVAHSPGYGATSGNDALLVEFDVTAHADPFSWAFRVDMDADSQQNTDIAANVGKYITFDVVNDEALTATYDDIWQLFAVLQVHSTDTWNQNDDIWPNTTTLSEDFTTSVSFPIPEGDYSEGATIYIGVKAAPNVGGEDIFLIFDNFRITEEPAGGNGGGETQWLGYDVNAEGWADTAGWLGNVWVTEAPWVWSDLGWIYVAEESYDEASGAWLFRPKTE